MVSRWRKGTNDQDDSGSKGGSISKAEAERRALMDNTKENTKMAKSKDNTEDRQLSEEGQDNVKIGGVYKEDGGTREVIPFFVDLHTAEVRFSQVGRSSEDRMRSSDFLNRFKLQEKSSLAEATPAESQKAAETRMKRKNEEK